jgi:hypothetical protein
MGWFNRKEKKDTPTDRACEMLQDFFHEQGVEIKVKVEDREEPSVTIVIAPSSWDSVFASVSDTGYADEMAKETQKAGFILGEMSKSVDKPRSVQIDYNSIDALDGNMLEQFVKKYVASNQKRTAGN